MDRIVLVDDRKRKAARWFITIFFSLACAVEWYIHTRYKSYSYAIRISW